MAVERARKALFRAPERDEEPVPPGQWEGVVTATNSAGEGPGSNTMTVVVA